MAGTGAGHDRLWVRCLCVAFLVLALAAAPARAEDLVQLQRAPEQGALVHGTAPPGSRLWLDGKSVRVEPDGAFVLGFGRDATATAILERGDATGATQRETLGAAPRGWQVQRIDGLPQGQVSPDTAALERIRAEQKRLDAARAVDSAEQGFRGPFAWPAGGPISGVYGSQRVLNGEPRAAHVGLDIAGPEGAPVRAPAAGV